MAICLTYNVRGGKALPCTPEELKRARAMVTPESAARLKSLTLALSEREGTLTVEERDKMEEEKKKIKLARPALLPHASSFDDYERKADKAHPSGLVFFDVDHFEGDIREFYEQKVKDRCKEWKLAMFEFSASGDGFHIFFVKPAGMTIREAQQWMAENLGVKFDAGTFDLARACYCVGEDYVLYQDDDLLFGEIEIPEEELALYKAPKAPYAPNPASPLMGKSRGETSGIAEVVVDGEASAFGLKAFDLCLAEAGLTQSEIDIPGERNWHNTLKAILSVGLCQIVEKGQLLAVLKERMPNYAETDDCKRLVADFYKNYTDENGRMSMTLRTIYAQASKYVREQLNTLPNKGEMPKAEGADDESDLALVSAGYNPPPMPKKLPRVLELLTANYDPRFRPMLTLAALPILAAHASHYRSMYINGSMIGPQSFVVCIGGSGKGKGNVTKLYEFACQNTLQASDLLEFEKVRINTEEREKKANAKDKPAKYHPKLRLFETTSVSSILELQTNLGKNGMLLGHFSEADGFSAGGFSVRNTLSVLFRKAWSGEMQTQFYLSDSSCNTMIRMCASLLVCGTVKSVLVKMLGGDNTESGMMQRFIPVLVPTNKRTFRPPKCNLLSEDERKECQELLQKLYTQDLSLGEGTLELELPKTSKLIEQWYDELEERYNDGLLSDPEADISARCGENMMKAVIPLVALEGEETKEILDLARWVGDVALYNMYYLFGQKLQENLRESAEVMNKADDARKTAEPILNMLPEIFTTNQIKDMRIQMGQSDDVRSLLSRYCKNKKITRLGKGVYKKCVIVAQQKCDTLHK